MEVRLSRNAKKECTKYAQYITKKNKNLSAADKKSSFESYLKNTISHINNHKDTIYPTNCIYGRDYKMYIEKDMHRVFFYEIKIIKTEEKEKEVAVIEECPHTTEFVKTLEEKKIKPKEDANPEILLKLLELEREDAVAALPDDSDGILPEDVRKGFEEREKELEKKLESQKESKKDSTSKSGDKKDRNKDSNKDSKSIKENPRKIWKRRPKENGKGLTKNYYNIHNPESSISQEQFDELVRNYEESNESLKDMKDLIMESNIISLGNFIKRLVG